MTAFERRVKRLRKHILGHSKEVKEPTDKEKSLEDLKVEELKELAKEKGIEGYSKLKKEELIDLLAEGE